MRQIIWIIIYHQSAMCSHCHWFYLLLIFPTCRSSFILCLVLIFSYYKVFLSFIMKKFFILIISIFEILLIISLEGLKIIFRFSIIYIWLIFGIKLFKLIELLVFILILFFMLIILKLLFVLKLEEFFHWYNSDISNEQNTKT